MQLRSGSHGITRVSKWKITGLALRRITAVTCMDYKISLRSCIFVSSFLNYTTTNLQQSTRALVILYQMSYGTVARLKTLVESFTFPTRPSMAMRTATRGHPFILYSHNSRIERAPSSRCSRSLLPLSCDFIAKYKGVIFFVCSNCCSTSEKS